VLKILLSSTGWSVCYVAFAGTCRMLLDQNNIKSENSFACKLGIVHRNTKNQRNSAKFPTLVKRKIDESIFFLRREVE
jgi:hypothetical protein